MNLRGIVNGATRSINPNAQAVVKVSTGYVTSPSGKRTPTFTETPVSVQVQALTGKDLRQVDGLNLNGTLRAVYVNGAFAATIRAKQAGGDVIVFAPGTLQEGDTWLLVQVLEQWPDWCKFAMTLQNGT
jgi:hypothetical protein